MGENEIQLIIADYRLDWDVPKGPLIPGVRNRFEHVSFVHWALDELETYILCNPDVDPIDSTNRFINKISGYMHKYPRTRVMFFIAADVARDILDILICAS